MKSRLLLLVPILLAFVAPNAAQAAPFNARLSASTHTPKVNKPWKVTVTARTKSGKALTGTVSYEVLLKGVVVGRRAGGTLRGGRFSDTQKWPGAAVGMKLTFRAVVKTKLGTVRLPWAIRVHK